MRMRPIAVAGLALSTAMVVSGCAGSGSSTASTPSASTPSASIPPAVTALAGLSEAAKKLEDRSLRLSVTVPGAMDVSGVADTKNARADLTMRSEQNGEHRELRLLLVGTDFYLQIAAGVPGLAPGVWWHVDASAVPADSVLNPHKIVDTRTFLGGMVTAEKVGAGSYQGTLDKETFSAGGKVAPASPGPAAEQVPFTARVDEQGRLSELVIETGATGGPVRARYSDFGAPVTVEAPAPAKVIEMPAQMRDGLLR